MSESNEISIKWSTEDVQSIRPDLDDGKARAVLSELGRRHNASIGINWTVIGVLADEMYPRQKPKIKPFEEWDDPKMVGSSEYHTLYEFFEDIQMDEDLDDGELLELIDSSLDEFISICQALKEGK